MKKYFIIVLILAALSLNVYSAEIKSTSHTYLQDNLKSNNFAFNYRNNSMLNFSHSNNEKNFSSNIINYAYLGGKSKRNGILVGAIIFTGLTVVTAIAGGALTGMYFFQKNMRATPFSDSFFSDSNNMMLTGLLVGMIVSWSLSGLFLVGAIIMWSVYGYMNHKKRARIHLDNKKNEIALSIKL